MELLKIAGLQGLLPLVAIITLVKISYEKVFYIFSLNEFDKIFIPESKVKIYGSIKFLLTIILVNIFIMLFSSSISHYIDFPMNAVHKASVVIGYVLNITLLLIVVLAIYSRTRDKLKFIKSKKDTAVNDWIVIITIYIIHMATFLIFIVQVFYQFFEYKKVNNLLITEGALFLSLTILSMFYVYMIYRIVLWLRYGKKEKSIYKIKNHKNNTSLFVLKSKDDNTLILGDLKTYEESKSFYIYNMKEDRYIEFEKVKELDVL